MKVVVYKLSAPSCNSVFFYTCNNSELLNGNSLVSTFVNFLTFYVLFQEADCAFEKLIIINSQLPDDSNHSIGKILYFSM